MNGSYPEIWQAIARELPERTAIITVDGERWDYARFAREAGSLAARLAEAGVGRGDAVAMLLHNRPEFLITFFACLATGATPVPLNYRLRPGELAELLDDSGAEALIFPTSFAESALEGARLAADELVLVEVRDQAPTPAASALLGVAHPLDWAELVAGDEPLPAAAPEDGEFWIYTGGTTGRPKAVRWSAAAMFQAQLVMTYGFVGLDAPDTLDDAVRIAADPGLPSMVNLPLAPLMHGTALTTTLNALTVGGTALLTCSPRLDAEAALRFANRERATRIVVAGDGVALPLAEAAERLGIGLPTVSSIMSSGMRFSPEVKRRLHALGELTIQDLLASTEGGAFAVTITRGAQDLPGSPELLPTAVVLDEQQNEVQEVVGAVGTLAQRGAMPLGYHRDHEKTAATFLMIRGVRHVVPGDRVRVLEGRHIEFLGRGSTVVNTGGEKVYPPEVEEALMAHPAVADAVVLGVPDARFGELVAAVVERSAPVEASELMEHVGRSLAGYKRPRIVMFRESLDRSPTGKVDLNRLREEVVRAAASGEASG